MIGCPFIGRHVCSIWQWNGAVVIGKLSLFFSFWQCPKFCVEEMSLSPCMLTDYRKWGWEKVGKHSQHITDRTLCVKADTERSEHTKGFWTHFNFYQVAVGIPFMWTLTQWLLLVFPVSVSEVAECWRNNTFIQFTESLKWASCFSKLPCFPLSPTPTHLTFFILSTNHIEAHDGTASPSSRGKHHPHSYWFTLTFDMAIDMKGNQEMNTQLQEQTFS